MSREFVDKLGDWVQWFHEHRHDATDLEKRVDFLQKSVEGLFDCLSFVAQDLNNLEGRPPEAIGRRLYLPTGMSFSGSLQRFG